LAFCRGHSIPMTNSSDKATAFCINQNDNVAVLLCDCNREDVHILGECKSSVIEAKEEISCHHKIALKPIPEGTEIVKCGTRIGIATTDISPGTWVHLHNCRSALDERSASFDLHSGVPRERNYE